MQLYDIGYDHSYTTSITGYDPGYITSDSITIDDFNGLKDLVYRLNNEIQILKEEVANLKCLIAEMGWSVLIEQAKENCIE